MSWAEWLAYMDREETKRVSYAPLTSADIPLIRAVAHANLRNIAENEHDIRCTCPLHGGDPSATTLRINLAVGASVGVGVWKCYSCQRGGHWNKLAVAIGVDPLVVDENPEWVDLVVPVEAVDYQPPAGLHPWPSGAVWERTNKDGSKTVLPAKVFGLLGAKYWCCHGTAAADCVIGSKSYVEGDRVPEVRAWLPVERDRGTVVAHVAALLSTRYPGAKKYLNSAGSWPRRYIAMHVAALELAKMLGVSTLVVVEGPADAMRLMSLGIPAVPLLGVGNWTEDKAGLLASCWSCVLVCLDADTAGQAGQARVLASLCSRMSAEGVVLPDNQDPASMPQADLIAAFGAHGVRPRQWSL